MKKLVALLGLLALTLNPVFAQVLSASGPNSLQPTAVGIAAVGQIPGTPNGAAASVGKIGEKLTSTVLAGSAVTCTSSSYTNITNIVLTPGSWTVYWTVWLLSAGTTTFTGLHAGASDLSTLGTDGGPQKASYPIAGTLTSASPFVLSGSGVPYLVTSGTTTVNLKCRPDYTGSDLTAYGTISAVRDH